MTCEDFPTQTRLLDAAEELFLSKGFENVSIRELAAAADVNVAAVNYHFQTKNNLYREVIGRRFTAHRRLALEALDEVLVEHDGRPPLDAVIHAIVHLHLRQALADRPGGALLNLVMREMHGERNESSSVFLREMVAPFFRAFSEAILKARPQLDPEQVGWIIASIVGQIHHFAMRWQRSRLLLEAGDDAVEIMLQAFPVLGGSLDDYVERVADHVTRFSAAAVDALYPEVDS